MWSDPAVRASHSVIVELASVLGQYRDNLVLVGGWVPPLLLPDATEPHMGSYDVDFVLDHEKLRADAYERVEALLNGAGYVRKDVVRHPFSFFKTVTVDGEPFEVQVDLLAGEYDGSGSSRRTQKVQDLMARKARGADLVFDLPQQAEFQELVGVRPDGAQDRVRLRVAGIVPFLVMKAMALRDRDKSKDGFDIIFCLDQYPGGLSALAEQLRPHKDHGLVREALGIFREKFQSPEHKGSLFAARAIQGLSEADVEIRAQKAFVLMRDLLMALELGE